MQSGFGVLQVGYNYFVFDFDADSHDVFLLDLYLDRQLRWELPVLLITLRIVRR